AFFERAVQFTEQSVLTSWPAAKPMAHSLLNSPLAGDTLGGGWSPAVAGADTGKNNAAAAAVARATEAPTREDLLYVMNVFACTLRACLRFLGRLAASCM